MTFYHIYYSEHVKISEDHKTIFLRHEKFKMQNNQVTYFNIREPATSKSGSIIKIDLMSNFLSFFQFLFFYYERKLEHTT